MGGLREAAEAEVGVERPKRRGLSSDGSPDLRPLPRRKLVRFIERDKV